MKNTKIVYTLITGASEGLGKALALECAKRNMNLVLVALPSIELYQLASFIRKKYSVNVCEFEMDLVSENDRLHLWRQLKQRNISVNMLINNAGIGCTKSFDENSFDTWQRQIQLNVTSVIHLTHLFLPELKLHSKSYLLNISSLAIFFYLPQKQVYGATKSFIHFFSKSLRRELRKNGTTVSVLCPGGIKTTPQLFLLNQHGSLLARLASMTPEQVAFIAINGLLANKEIMIPGKLNRMFMYLDRFIPAGLKIKLIEKQVQKMQNQNVDDLVKGRISSFKNVA